MYLERRRSLKVSRFILTLLFTYAILCAAITLQQRSLMYFPDRTAFEPAAWGMEDFKPLHGMAADGLVVTSWYHAPRNAAKPVIVFMQGNAGHPGHRNYKISPWLQAGYGIMLVGYRGYGGNPGKPTEQGLYADARAALDVLAAEGVADKSVVLYGESLGTGVAVQMAAERKAAGMILESPYSTTADVGAWRYPFLPVRYLMWDRFESINKIASVRLPLLLVHGEADNVVPARFGKQLFAEANEPKQAMFMPGLDHNTIYSNEVRDGILHFLAGFAAQ